MCRPFVPPGRGKSSEGRGGEEGVGKGGRGVGRRKGGEEWEGKGGKEGGGKVRGREVPTVIWQRRGGGERKTNFDKQRQRSNRLFRSSITVNEEECKHQENHS